MEWIEQVMSFWRSAPDWWIWSAIVAVPAILLAWVIRGMFARSSRSAAPRSVISAAPSGAPKELHKTIARLEGENAALSAFFKYLPDFTKEINSRLERRAIPPLLQKVIEVLLAPTQILIFLADDERESLTLIQQKGAGADIKKGLQVKFGEGRIGYVAQHRVTMGVDDYIREMRHSGEMLEAASHFGLKSELCAPMLHEGKTLGVVSVGGITKHNKYEKNILSLLADLGSIALYNNLLFSQTQEMANCDGLTRLYNKRFFMDRLGEELRQAELRHHPVSLFMFDLDNFKHYNDTQGHQAGDEVLKITGQILREAVRPEDIPARYGGEEFIVIWARSSKDDSMAAAERIRVRVAGHPYVNRESQPLKVVSLSGGVATFPDDGRTGPDLIKAADAALYKAKHDGRNRVYPSKPQYFSDESEGVLENVNNG